MDPTAPCCPCLAEDPPPGTPSAQRSSFLCKIEKMGCELEKLGKEGGLKDLTKEKPLPSPTQDALSRQAAGSTAEAGALARFESREERRRIWD